ncbi:MAG: hypothetical protein QNJ63_24410 [Calothrix sp. MO_192.B10]|nr:hypothetical protein [Calothrix sp. MO_192.B10]
MSVINDFEKTVYDYGNLAGAIVDYLKTFVSISITDFEIDPPSNKLNVGEKARFKVQVLNKGNLKMTDVVIQVDGTTYADVSTDRSTWGSSASAPAISVNAHGDIQKTSYFYLKAKAATGNAKDIVKIRVNSWDGDFCHILHLHSTRSIPLEISLNKEISTTD